MNKRTYESTVKNIRAAYAALRAAYATAEYFEGTRICQGLDGLQTAVEALRVQVCRQCNSRGYYTNPGDPYTAYGCEHPRITPVRLKTEYDFQQLTTP